MNQSAKNVDPNSDQKRKGPETPGINHPDIQFGGNKPNGESKKVGDGTGHWSGH